MKSCLLHLGFPGKLVLAILKSLILSFKSFFQIWQARDSKEWIPTTRDPVINVNLKNYKQSVKSPKPIHSEKVQVPVDFAISKPSAKSYLNCGLLHKGNTCYINMLPFSVSVPSSSYGQISLSVTIRCLHLHHLLLNCCYC